MKFFAIAKKGRRNRLFIVPDFSYKKSFGLEIVKLLAFVAAFLLFAKAGAQSNVIVSFATTNPTPLNLGFAGYCTELGASSVEYYDTNFQQAVAPLSPGWLRYPGGAVNDAFSWTNGLTLTNWFSNFPASETNLLWAGAKIGNSKGGLKFSDFAAMCQNVGGAKIVVTINGFTDSAASAGAFAAYALSNHIPVAAWKLSSGGPVALPRPADSSRLSAAEAEGGPVRP